MLHLKRLGMGLAVTIGGLGLGYLLGGFLSLVLGIGIEDLLTYFIGAIACVTFVYMVGFIAVKEFKI